MNLVMTERKRCRKCNGGKLDSRVKRGVLVKTFLFWLPIKRYRCDFCKKKSYVFGSALSSINQSDLQAL
jgi:hypothetical protein